MLHVLRRGRSNEHIENMLHILRRGSVGHCFKLLHNVRTEQPKGWSQRGDRGSNPVAINQFLIFFPLLDPNVLVFFSFFLIFIIFRGLLHFT